MLKGKTKIFKALSDPNRLRILKMLQTKHICVCEMTSILNLATSTVSKHLSILRDGGFIIENKDGRWVNFQINPTPLDVRISSILSSLNFWISDCDLIVSDLEKVKNVDRFKVCSK